MLNLKYSPAPWRVNPEIFHAAMENENINEDEKANNSFLASLSPEMFEALKGIKQITEKMIPDLSPIIGSKEEKELRNILLIIDSLFQELAERAGVRFLFFDVQTVQDVIIFFNYLRTLGIDPDPDKDFRLYLEPGNNNPLFPAYMAVYFNKVMFDCCHICRREGQNIYLL